MRFTLALLSLLLLSSCGNPSATRFLEGRGIKAVCPWNAGGKALTAVARVKNVREQGKTFVIRYVEVFEGDRSVFSTGDVGEVVQLFTTAGKDGQLVAVCKPGDDYRIYAYALGRKGIEQVLDAGSQRLPEVVRTTGDDVPVLLITDTLRRPWQTFRYQWDGTRFKMVKTQLYPARFR